jgi:3'-5' exoribonuclease 1
MDSEDWSSHSPFSNAVYKELSKINGKINQMSKIEMERQLRKLKLSTEGSGDILKKRLKNYYTKKKLADENLQVTNNLYPYYVIIDFEATCEEVNDPDFP